MKVSDCNNNVIAELFMFVASDIYHVHVNSIYRHSVLITPDIYYKPKSLPLQYTGRELLKKNLYFCSSFKGQSTASVRGPHFVYYSTLQLNIEDGLGLASNTQSTDGPVTGNSEIQFFLTLVNSSFKLENKLLRILLQVLKKIKLSKISSSTKNNV